MVAHTSEHWWVGAHACKPWPLCAGCAERLWPMAYGMGWLGFAEFVPRSRIMVAW